MSRLTLAAIAITIVLLGCTRRQADFAWFALAVASEIVEASNEAAAEEAARRQPVAVASPGASPADLERNRQVAMELTTIAIADANDDNCGSVARTSQHVRVIDPDVFTSVFLKDAAIQRCLAITE
jgi:uncharacterized lipoprotein NlpE involved in copper resistance